MKFTEESSETVAGNSVKNCMDTNSVGAWLKKTRIDRNESLEEVSGVTRIGKTYLEAIEEGALSRLPSQAYTRGFIRLYAAHLGLPPEKALAMLHESMSGQTESSTDTISPQQPERNPLSPHRLRLIVVPLLGLVILAGYFLIKPQQSKAPARKSLPDSPAMNLTEPVPDKTREQAVPKTTPAEVIPLPQKNDEVSRSDGIILKLKAVTDGRFHITIDGSVSQEYELVTGDLVEWKAEKSFILDLENAASVEGELDNVKLKPFGEPGKSVHLELNADGIH